MKKAPDASTALAPHAQATPPTATVGVLQNGLQAEVAAAIQQPRAMPQLKAGSIRGKNIGAGEAIIMALWLESAHGWSPESRLSRGNYKVVKS